MSRMPGDWRHSLMAMDGEHGCRDQVDDGIQVEFLAPPETRGFLAVARSQADLIRRVSPDLVLTYNWGAIETVLGARFAGHRGLVHHEEGFGADEVLRPHRRRSWVRRGLLRRSVVIVPSATLMGIANREWRVPSKFLRHLPNGVDLQRFRPGRDRGDGRGQGAEENVIIGHVGGLRPEKNQALLLRAFACMEPRDR